MYCTLTSSLPSQVTLSSVQRFCPENLFLDHVASSLLSSGRKRTFIVLGNSELVCPLLIEVTSILLQVCHLPFLWSWPLTSRKGSLTVHALVHTRFWTQVLTVAGRRSSSPNTCSRDYWHLFFLHRHSFHWLQGLLRWCSDFTVLLRFEIRLPHLSKVEIFLPGTGFPAFWADKKGNVGPRL